jgi:hypothetical protein
LRGRKGLIAAVPFAPPNEPHSPKEIKACVNSDEKSAPAQKRTAAALSHKSDTRISSSAVFLKPSHIVAN